SGAFAAQQAGTHGMEGSEPDALEILVDEGDHAAFHFAGSLVGEGDSDDIVRRNTLALDEVSQAAGEHAGLAGAGTGQHERLTITSGDGLALLRIEIVKQMIGHRSIYPGRRIEAEVVNPLFDGILMLTTAATEQWRGI